MSVAGLRGVCGSCVLEFKCVATAARIVVHAVCASLAPALGFFTRVDMVFLRVVCPCVPVPMARVSGPLVVVVVVAHGGATGMGVRFSVDHTVLTNVHGIFIEIN